MSFLVNMALEFVALELALLGERVRRVERRVERRRLRDAQNPFHLPRDEFIDCFRLTPELILSIAHELRADLECERSTGLSPKIKVNFEIKYCIN